MRWEDYKPLVATSREVVVFPFFLESMKNFSGVCLDIGCGAGDLTRYLAQERNLQIVGIDNNLPRSLGSDRLTERVHLVAGDVSRNAILETESRSTERSATAVSAKSTTTA